MALVHNAQLVPSKPELLRRWVPTQPWWAWSGAALTVIGAYRFDDPVGEVGIETHLLQVEGGPVVQVGLTYRGAPFEGGTLVATMQHSVLGKRWVYDGCTDPVYANAFATAMFTGGTEAELVIESPEGRSVRPATVTVRGTGSASPVPSIESPAPTTGQWATTMHGDAVTIELLNVLHIDESPRGTCTLLGTWPDLGYDTLLAVATVF